MIKPINEVNVSEDHLAILLQHKDKQFELKKEVHTDIFPVLIEGLRQIRELTQNIAIIAGAIAAFTIPVVNTPFIQIKLLAYLSITTLFLLIAYAVFHLTSVITREVNELSRQHSTYIELLDDEIDRINSVIETGEITKLAHSEQDRVKILDKLKELQTIPKPDKSLDRIKWMLIAALIFLVLSFVPLNAFQSFINFLYNISSTR